MDGDSNLRSEILQVLHDKAQHKQQAYNSTFEAFQQLKEMLHELVNEINEELPANADKRIKLEYHDRGTYEADIRVAGDMLVFFMHTDVFRLEREHQAWKHPYLQQDVTHGYCGIINVFNFLADSFRFKRDEDEGYLVGRIFVNDEKHFFVEGKRQEQFSYSYFGQQAIDEASLRRIAENAILYALNFDLLAPPYEVSKTVTVGQVTNKSDDVKLIIGKRIGYKFSTDDVGIAE